MKHKNSTESDFYIRIYAWKINVLFNEMTSLRWCGNRFHWFCSILRYVIQVSKNYKEKTDRAKTSCMLNDRKCRLLHYNHIKSLKWLVKLIQINNCIKNWKTIFSTIHDARNRLFSVHFYPTVNSILISLLFCYFGFSFST